MGMIDISKKKITQREAVVEGKIFLKASVIQAIKKKKIPKGDVLLTSRLAGIWAAKKTSEIIPLCHPIPVEYLDIKFSLGENQIKLTTTVRGRTKTGPEMEAFIATVVSALTIYDMCKSLDREAVISEIKLIKKKGGRSGIYLRNSNIKNRISK